MLEHGHGIAVAVERATFAFGEVRVGVAPAVISVVCLARMHASDARELLLTGERVSAERVKHAGLVTAVAEDVALDAVTRSYVDRLMLGGPEALAPAMVERLQSFGLTGSGDLLPRELFLADGPFGRIGWGIVIIGGFLVGFGARYAGGCTGGHTIAGIATLQRASLVASIAFFIGGLVTARWFLPALWEALV